MADKLVSTIRKAVLSLVCEFSVSLVALVIPVAVTLLLACLVVYAICASAYWIFWWSVGAIGEMLGIPYSVMASAVVWSWRQLFPPAPTPREQFVSALGTGATTVYRAVEIPIVGFDTYVGWDFALQIAVWVLVSYGAYRLSGLSLRVVRQRRLRSRGLVVSAEAVQPGSDFVIASGPAFTVVINCAGLITDSLVGLGCRVGSWLVMPGHVYEQARGDEGLLLESVSGKKTLFRGKAKQSVKYSDIKYVRVPPEVWAKLGVTKAGKAGTVRDDENARVWGWNGATAGIVGRKTEAEFLFYTGSTLPGYSGTTYVVNSGQWVGMHLGSVTSGSQNVGARADIIEKEVENLEAQFQTINPEGFRETGAKTATTSTSTAERKTHAANRRYEDEDNRMFEDLNAAYSIKTEVGKQGNAYARTSYEELKKKFEPKGPSWYEELDDEAVSNPIACVRSVASRMPPNDLKDLIAVLSQMALAPGQTGVETLQAQGQDEAEVLLYDKAAMSRVQTLETAYRTLSKRLEIVEEHLQLSRESPKPQSPTGVVEEKVQVEAKPKMCGRCKVKFPSVSSWKKHSCGKGVEAPKGKSLAPEKKVAVESGSSDKAKQPVSSSAKRPGECQFCGKKYESQIKLKAHVFFQHNEEMKRERIAKMRGNVGIVRVAGESAVDHDEEPSVAVSGRAFLGKRSLKMRKSV